MPKSPRQLDREISDVLACRSAAKTTKRWVHRDVARRHGVPEDVVRRIYAAVQTAKRQGLHGGYTVDLIERSVGRKLINGEYSVAHEAREHLNYSDIPGGYGGPKPRGSAQEPPRELRDEKKADEARRLGARADAVVQDVLRRRKQWARGGWDERKDRDLLRQAAADLDVAADLFEEAGPVFQLRAGTLRERARRARSGDYEKLATYE